MPAWVWPLVGLTVAIAALVWARRRAAAAQIRADTLYRQLYEGERAIVARVRELEQMKNQLSSVVSHEFRTPLTGILGYTRTMQAHLGSMDEATVREILRYIDRQGSRLAILVDNLSIVAESRGVEPSGQSNLGRVAARVGVMLAQHPGVLDRPLQMTVPGELDVSMSAATAHRVLFNLLDNAVKFGSPGTDVRVEARHEDGEVVVDVTNVGPPIPPEVCRRMFEPFVQADSSDNRAADGMGLGLHVVRRLVESHHGTVEVHQSDGVVVFRVRVPDHTAAARRRVKVR